MAETDEAEVLGGRLRPDCKSPSPAQAQPILIPEAVQAGASGRRIDTWPPQDLKTNCRQRDGNRESLGVLPRHQRREPSPATRSH